MRSGCRTLTHDLVWTKSGLRFRPRIRKLVTAALTGPEAVGNKLVYHFARAIGTKG